MDDDHETQIRYNQLKSQVILSASNTFSLEQVKDHFSEQINSRRSLDHLKTLAEVFQLLEKRDILSFKKVYPLLSFGELIRNERIKEIVRVYEKMCLDEEDWACSVCSLTFVDVRSSPLGDVNQNCVVNSRNNVSVDTLSEALENISLSIGSKWGVLVRALGLKEFQIEHCIQQHPSDHVCQARRALQIWRQMQKENATIERLDSALELRLCKREGFGVHLRETVIGLDMLR